MAGELAHGAIGMEATVAAREEHVRARGGVALHADLAADGAASRARRIPILLFFEREDCPYCERALREHLVPMSAEAPWRDDALMRQLALNRARAVREALLAKGLPTDRLFIAEPDTKVDAADKTAPRAKAQLMLSPL